MDSSTSSTIAISAPRNVTMESGSFTSAVWIHFGSISLNIWNVNLS